ncbi:hypothetical protein [Qipengyuania qiaonensis]|uniref:PDZ domain-containing protein n=1 Tax=Qipengyuania qiaonensis TaxID=2867240 RepID=A0ABS7J0V8_9SPHN|nr:hypothetical protein [Qipengyuania qiaonensis]MBX7480983.1 hypothetical protein [Qipengyuania qiaonensis]
MAIDETVSPRREPDPLEVFQKSEDRLFRVGYRLATANASFCESASLTSGFLIHDADSYGNPEAVRSLLQLSGDIGVQAVAPGSPAGLAGIAQNDTVLAIDRKSFRQDWPRTDPSWKRVFAIRDAVDFSLSRGSVDITYQTPGRTPQTATIEGVPACPTRFELVGSKKNAAADGTRVLVGENFPGLAYDEAVFASAIAHEMAHNIFSHPQTFGETGWKTKLIRLSERDADRLMPWLLQNAGYDPRAAVRFMSLWGPKYGGQMFRKRTHDGWDERVEFIEAEIARMERVLGSDGVADWRTHFVSELDEHLCRIDIIDRQCATRKLEYRSGSKIDNDMN